MGFVVIMVDQYYYFTFRNTILKFSTVMANKRVNIAFYKVIFDYKFTYKVSNFGYYDGPPIYVFK